MRVLWVFDYLAPPLQQLAVRLAEESDISLEVMTRWDERPPRFPASIPLTYLHCRHKLDFAAQRKIRTKLQSADFDVVHAYTSRNLANLIGACRGLRPLPKIIGYRGVIKPLHLLDPANWLTFWHPRVAKIICVSEAVGHALRRSGVAQSKLVAVVEGCDPDQIQPLPRSARDEFDIPQDAFVVGAVANMRRVKGIDVLLQAAMRLTDLPDIFYLLIGDVSDPLVSQLAADDRISARVRLAGSRPNGCQYTSLFDVYAAPSRMEGLGMSVVEAMAQRVCPLASDVGGLPELIRHEQDGLLVPTEDSVAVADAIRRLYHDSGLRSRLAESAYRRAARDFSIAAWAQRLLNVYRETEQTGST